MEISNLRAIELDELVRTYEMHRFGRLRALGEIFQNLQKELSKRDLTELSTERVFEQYMKISNTIANENLETSFTEKRSMDERLNSMFEDETCWVS